MAKLSNQRRRIGEKSSINGGYHQLMKAGAADSAAKMKWHRQ